jgi:hypothetical protein
MVLDLDVDVPAVVLGEGKGLLKGGDGQSVKAFQRVGVDLPGGDAAELIAPGIP